MVTNVGNGNTNLFWTDNWLEGISIAGLAPNIFAFILKRRENQLTVREPLMDYRWVQDIIGGSGTALYL
jgi:hypothetical protein